MKTFMVGLMVLLGAGCGAKGMPSKDACGPLAKSIDGANCREETPGGLAGAATDGYQFDLVTPKGETCQVLAFKNADDLATTEKAFQAAAMLAGPHRYSNKSKLLFVQCNSGLSKEDGAKVEKALGAL